MPSAHSACRSGQQALRWIAAEEADTLWAGRLLLLPCQPHRPQAAPFMSQVCPQLRAFALAVSATCNSLLLDRGICSDASLRECCLGHADTACVCTHTHTHTHSRSPDLFSSSAFTTTTYTRYWFDCLFSVSPHYNILVTCCCMTHFLEM